MFGRRELTRSTGFRLSGVPLNFSGEREGDRDRESDIPGGAAYAHVRFICAPGVSLEHVWEKESERERERAREERERETGAPGILKQGPFSIVVPQRI